MTAPASGHEVVEVSFERGPEGVVRCSTGGGRLVEVGAFGAFDVPFTASASRSAFADLAAGRLEALAGFLIVGRAVVVDGVAPFGAFLLDANRVVPGLPGATSALQLVDDERGNVGLATLDGAWVDALPDDVAHGSARLLGGVPQFLRLLSGHRTVRSDVVDGLLLGDMAGLSHLSWMLEQPAWLAVVEEIGPLLLGAAWLVEAMAGSGGAAVLHVVAGA